MSDTTATQFSPDDRALLSFVTLVCVLANGLAFWQGLRLIPGWAPSSLPVFTALAGLVAGAFLQTNPGTKSETLQTPWRAIFLILCSSFALFLAFGSGLSSALLRGVGLGGTFFLTFLLAGELRFVLESMRGNEGLQMPEFLLLKPLAMAALLLTLFGPPAFWVYSGPVGQSLLFGSLAALWLVRIVSLHHRKTATLPLVSFFVTVAGLVWVSMPWPSQLYAYTPVHAKRVQAQIYTLQARRSESKQYYAVTSRKSMIFDTVSAYRTAESMVHPAMLMLHRKPKRILVVGGETGSVLHELGKYRARGWNPEVVHLPLYPEVLDYFSKTAVIRRLHAQKHRLATVVLPPPSSLGMDGLQEALAGHAKKPYDLILLDLPAWNDGQRRMYQKKTLQFWLKQLSSEGLLVSNLDSPYQNASRFWCLAGLWGHAGGYVLPYHVSPGVVYDYGFAMVSRTPVTPFAKPLVIPVSTRYLTTPFDFRLMARFPKSTQVDGRFLKQGCLQKNHAKK